MPLAFWPVASLVERIGGGQGGIRTHEPLARLPDFESCAKVYTAPHFRAAAFMTATPSAARASGFGLQKVQGSSSLADFPFLHFFLPDFLPFSEFGKMNGKKTFHHQHLALRTVKFSDQTIMKGSPP